MVTQGKLYYEDKFLSKVYYEDKQLNQIISDDIAYLPMDDDITPDDLVITFQLDSGLTELQVDEAKQIAVGIGLFGEKIVLRWNTYFDEVEEYFNDEYDNLQFFIGSTRLRHSYIDIYDSRFFIFEIPYTRIDEVMTITAVIYGDKEKHITYNPNSYSLNYYDLNNGLPLDYVGESDVIINVDGRDVLSTWWGENAILRAEDKEYRDILGIEQTINYDSTKSFIQIDEDDTPIIPSGVVSFAYLQTLIIFAQKIRGDNYTSSSYDNLQDVIVQVSSLTDETEPQDLENAIGDLVLAIESLDKDPFIDKGTLYIGSGQNKTGLFITPYPDTDLESNISSAEQYSQTEYEFLLSRLRMHNEGEYVQYQPDYYNTPSNKAIKNGNDYNNSNYVMYEGYYYIAWLLVLQNIISVKYDQTMVDSEYEITYPEGTFDAYDLVGLKREVVQQVGQGSIADLTVVGGYYKTVSHSQTGTVTQTVKQPNTNHSWGTVSIGSYGGSTTLSLSGKPSKNHNLVKLVFSCIAMHLVACSIGGAIDVNLSRVSGGSTSIISNFCSGTISVPNANIGMDGTITNPSNAGSKNLAGIFITQISGGNTFSSIKATCEWADLLETVTTTTYYTNANFRSLNIPINSDTSELVIENNQQTIGKITLYTDSNTNLGNVLTNQNTKYVAVNNRAGGNYNFELTCGAVSGTQGVNWFTGLFLKDIYNSINLDDVSYELEMRINHTLTNQQVTNALTDDNNNRNIYRRIISITDVPWMDKKISKRLSPDFSNVRLVLKEDKVLLNHSFDSSGNLLVEFPDKYLQNEDITINLIILPKSYEYEGFSVDAGLSLLPVTNVDYILY